MLEDSFSDKIKPAPKNKRKIKVSTIEIEGEEYEVTGYADDGLPIIKGVATSTQDGFDEDGNPKISVNVVVPSVTVGVIPGKVE